jgi:hypothetical protein
VLREFSTRRREIEAHLDEHGQHRARAAQYATYSTRRAKDTSIDAEGLVPGWKARAAALGLDAGALAAVLDRGVVVEPPTPGSAEADRLYRWLAGPEGLTARASTFGEREVIKAICNALPAGGSVDRASPSARSPTGDGESRSRRTVDPWGLLLLFVRGSVVRSPESGSTRFLTGSGGLAPSSHQLGARPSYEVRAAAPARALAA